MSLFTPLRHAIHIGLDVQGFFNTMRQQHGNSFFVHMPGLKQVRFSSEPDQVADLFRHDSDTLTSSLPSPIQPLLGKGSLILLQGQAHTDERQHLKPLFQGQCLHRYNRFVEEAVAEACANVQPIVDAQAFMQRVTLDVMIRAVFGLSSAAERDVFASASVALIRTYTPLLMLLPWSRVRCGGISPWDRFLAARQRLDQLIYSEIDRRQDAPQQDDVLSHLLASVPENQSVDAALKRHWRDALTTLLLAGYETTANTLAWAVYYAATEPNWQSALAEEFTPQALQASEQTLTRAAMKSPQLDAFCKEVMRLRPAVPLVIRSVMAPLQWAGASLPVGTYAGVATFNLHTDPELYPDPLSFNPQRFLDRKYKPHEFVPFGGGDKKCLGYGLALHEMKIILATLLSRYHLWLDKPVKPRAVIQGLAMAPKPRLRIALTPRLHQ